MWGFVSCLIIAAVCLPQTWASQSSCMNLSETSGNITEVYPGPRDYRYSKCWNILNPDSQLLKIELNHVNFQKRSWNYVYLTITVNKTGERVKWGEDDIGKTITAYSNVNVYFYVDHGELTPNNEKTFELQYSIDDSIKGIEGVKEAHWQAVNWLKSNATSWKWINHIPKAVTALALSGEVVFNGKNLSDELMVKQSQLRISIALLRDSITNEQLSTFVNSVISTCHSPRNFYGHDLVEFLQRQMASENFTHPASYLALCNANATWPEKAYDDLLRIFNTISPMPFMRDYQAFAVMALACKLRRTGNHSIPNGEQLLEYYEKTIEDLKDLQKPSGSFGNVHRTALVTQALFSSGHEYDDDWHVIKAIKFLVQSMKTSQNDFLTTYLILPLLNEKSLVDIAFNNCSSSRNPDDLIEEITDYLGPKIQVQYSLFIGDTKEVIHNIVVKVPKHFTAFDVMQFAALKDKKYKFKSEVVSGALDIYEIADIPNDTEDGKFWLFYKKAAGPEQVFSHVFEGPTKTFLSEGDHIAMWYKKYITYA